MNYLKHYYRLVNRAHLEERSKKDSYYESHHVKPKSLGGKFLVLLTAREHYIAHFLLYKHYKLYGNKNEQIKSARAFNCMTFSSADNITRYNSHTFQYARIAFNKSISGINHPMYGKKHTVDARIKIKKALSKRSISEQNKMKERQRNAKLGTKRSDESKKSQSKSLTNYYKQRAPIIKLIKHGEEFLYSSYSQCVSEHNLSLSMIKRAVDGKPIAYGDSQSKIRTQKTENTIRCIIYRLN